MYILFISSLFQKRGRDHPLHYVRRKHLTPRGLSLTPVPGPSRLQHLDPTEDPPLLLIVKILCKFH